MSRFRSSLTLVVAIATGAMLAPVGVGATEASAPPHHPSTLLVAFEPGVTFSARTALHQSIGTSVANRFEELGIDVVRLPHGLAPVAAEAAYETSAAVAHATLNREIRALGIPNDSLFGNQWGFHNTGQPVAGSFVSGRADVDIDGPEAWDAAFGANTYDSGGGTRVAILDTGIDRGHVDLLGKVVACAGSTNGFGIVVDNACDDDNLHGTHVAGTVAANTNNGVGVAGTAPNAELAIFKFLNAGGVGFLADEIAGIEWAHRTARTKVISMSFGASEPDDDELAAVRAADDAGALLVAASGNDYDDTKNWPAAYQEVMSVTSVNAADTISVFANCNPDVEIAAPGEDVWSTFPGNAYGVISGTSMATPHISGIAALIMSEKGLSASQTRSLIKNAAEPVASTGGRAECNGVDRANLAAALGASGGTEPPPPPSPGTIAGTVNEGGKSKTAIAGAMVDCGTAGSSTTGSDGSYTIANVPVGSYTCTASASGYQPKSQSVNVYSGGTTTADFSLRAARSGGGKKGARG